MEDEDQGVMVADQDRGEPDVTIEGRARGRPTVREMVEDIMARIEGGGTEGTSIGEIEAMIVFRGIKRRGATARGSVERVRRVRKVLRRTRENDDVPMTSASRDRMVRCVAHIVNWQLDDGDLTWDSADVSTRNERRVELPIIDCMIYGTRVRALVDTGAMVSLVSEGLYSEWKGRHKLDEIPVSPVKIRGVIPDRTVKCRVRQGVTIGEQTF